MLRSLVNRLPLDCVVLRPGYQLEDVVALGGCPAEKVLLERAVGRRRLTRGGQLLAWVLVGS